MIKLHTKQVACSIADGSFELEELGEDDSIYHYDQAHMDALNSTRPWKEDPNYFKKVRISGEHASPPWRHRLRLAPPPPCVGFPSSPPRPRQSAGRPAARKHAHAPRAVVSLTPHRLSCSGGPAQDCSPRTQRRDRATGRKASSGVGGGRHGGGGIRGRGREKEVRSFVRFAVLLLRLCGLLLWFWVSTLTLSPCPCKGLR